VPRCIAYGCLQTNQNILLRDRIIAPIIGYVTILDDTMMFMSAVWTFDCVLTVHIGA
jgi:hypothetical protein